MWLIDLSRHDGFTTKSLRGQSQLTWKAAGDWILPCTVSVCGIEISLLVLCCSDVLAQRFGVKNMYVATSKDLGGREG